MADPVDLIPTPIGINIAAAVLAEAPILAAVFMLVQKSIARERELQATNTDPADRALQVAQELLPEFIGEVRAARKAFPALKATP